MPDKLNQVAAKKRLHEKGACPVCSVQVPWQTMQSHLETHLKSVGKGKKAWCSSCRIQLRPQEYLTHIRTVHGFWPWIRALWKQMNDETGGPHPMVPVPEQIDCHICGVTVGIHKLDRHFVRHRIAAKKQDGVKYARCPHCESTVRQSHLAKHLREIHHDAGGGGAFIQCPECQQTVKRHSLNEHLGVVHGQKPAAGKHPVAAAAARVGKFVRHARGSDTLVIDGMNLLRYDGADKPQLKYISSVVIGLIEAECIDFLLIFDANTVEALSETPAFGGSAVFRAMIELFPDHVCMTPRGIRADDFVLSEANRLGSTAVSNDRFRDYAEKYPWIADPKRLKQIQIVGNRIRFGGRNIGIRPGSLNEHHKRMKKLSRKIYGIFG